MNEGVFNRHMLDHTNILLSPKHLHGKSLDHAIGMEGSMLAVENTKANAVIDRELVVGSSSL